MNIAYLIPGIGMSEPERNRRQNLLRQLSGEEIKISILEVDEGPAAIETAEDEIAATGPTLKLARANETDFDAFIIGCFGDVGIDALRKEIGIPVIGPARATYAIMAVAFPRFGILSLNSGFIEEEREFAQKLGVLNQVENIVALDLPVDTIIGSPDETLQRITELVEQMDVAAAVPGCMSMAFLLEERKISAIQSTRIVNPLHCALRAAAMMIV
jgi:allantoin racemase